jgi:hypothetical protein
MAIRWRGMRKIRRGRRRYKKWYRNLLGNQKVGECGRRWERKLKLVVPTSRMSAAVLTVTCLGGVYREKSHFINQISGLSSPPSQQIITYKAFFHPHITESRARVKETHCI